MFESFCFGLGVVVGAIIGAKNAEAVSNGVTKIVEFIKSKVKKS